MKTITFKLPSRELELTDEDIKALKTQIDDYLSGTDEAKYNRLTDLPGAEFSNELANMLDDELMSFARLNESLEGSRPVTNRIRAEIFKRHQIGYKNLTSGLSLTQRNLLKKLGLKNR